MSFPETADLEGGEDRPVIGEGIGIGNAVNDLIKAVAAGSDMLPASGSVFTEIEIADGSQFDGNDGATAPGLIGISAADAYLNALALMVLQ